MSHKRIKLNQYIETFFPLTGQSLLIELCVCVCVCVGVWVCTKAVLLLAAWLTVDHQVRHLHGNLCLLLHFLLLSDL